MCSCVLLCGVYLLPIVCCTLLGGVCRGVLCCLVCNSCSCVLCVAADTVYNLQHLPGTAALPTVICLGQQHCPLSSPRQVHRELEGQRKGLAAGRGSSHTSDRLHLWEAAGLEEEGQAVRIYILYTVCGR